MDQISGLNQHARSCSTIILSSSSLNSSQQQPATAFRNDLSREHLFAEKDLKNSVGLLFNAYYYGAVPLQSTLSCRQQTPEALAQLADSCIRRVRIALLREQEYDDILQEDLPLENISQYMGPANLLRAVEMAIVSVTTTHLTIILAKDVYKMQFDIEKVSYARSNEFGYSAVIAKNKDQNRICMVLKSEHSHELVRALSQVFDTQNTTRVVKVKKESSDDEKRNEQIFPKGEEKDSNSTLNSCVTSMDFTGEKHPPWYHGRLSRTDAEKLILKDGDFLVRESTSIPGQIVLSSMYKSKHEHLLMIDPTDNSVRDMQGKVYPTVHDFIEHHCFNGHQVQFNNNLFLRLSMPVFSTISSSLKM